MYGYNILGQFLLSFIIGAICFVLVLIQGFEKIKKNKTYVATAAFVSDIMLLGLVYSIMYTREIILHEYDAGLVLRCADYIFYCGMMITWIAVLYSFYKSDDGIKAKASFLSAKAVGIIGIFLFLICTTVFMDANYYIENDSALLFYHICEIAYSVLSAMFILICTYQASNRIIITAVRRCVIVISIMLSLYYVLEIRASINLGVLEEISWTGGTFTLSSIKGWALVIVVICTLYFILKNDFQAFFNKPAEQENRDSLQKCIDEIAQSHKLTQREREIVELIYKGASNAIIAEELFISQNTVKSHMKNIYEKLNVHSRMELVYLINAQLFWNNKLIEDKESTGAGG